MSKILEVKDLQIDFATYAGPVHAIRNVSFDLNKGETLAIVGESGSGKSVTVRTVMGLLAPNAKITNGEVLFDGGDILKKSEKQLNAMRGNDVAMIFQDQRRRFTIERLSTSVLWRPTSTDCHCDCDY